MTPQHRASSLQRAVEDCARQAGSLAISYREKPLSSREKKPGDFVTDADVTCQRLVIDILRPLLPEAGFIAEEGCAEDSDRDYLWVIDPIDGTTNFMCGSPFFAVSIALTYKKRSVLGVVYAPALGQLFSAVEGERLQVNGQLFDQQSSAGPVALVSRGFYNKPIRELIARIERLGNQNIRLRTFGALALDMAYVAAGWQQAACFADPGWWDIAAAGLMVRCQGGSVLTSEGADLGTGCPAGIAMGKAVAPQWRRILGGNH